MTTLLARFPVPRGEQCEQRKAGPYDGGCKPKVDTASEAMKMARDSLDPVFHMRTSMLGLAYAFEAQRDYSSARDHAEDLLSDLGTGEFSLWHYVQQQFLLGRAILFSNDSPTLGTAGSSHLKLSFGHSTVLRC